ncbi:hypothetical protein ILYODFUR_004723 [Ilyodon furcidens]|uniref:Uncharacterized protein n=1 Tax=Ilyodon furcidens TaxID=33524 RepID=A0ABV0UGE9_9TELE
MICFLENIHSSLQKDLHTHRKMHGRGSIMLWGYFFLDGTGVFIKKVNFDPKPSCLKVQIYFLMAFKKNKHETYFLVRFRDFIIIFSGNWGYLCAQPVGLAVREL